MITFYLNGKQKTFKGNPDLNLLNYLRLNQRITSAKDGCSSQAACGACTVEIDGKAKLACTTKMSKLEGSEIFTMEGFPEYIKDTIVKAYVNKGAVQCGFCTPGFIARTKVLLQTNHKPSLEEVQKALRQHICRCTGYKKIEEAILHSAQVIDKKESLEITKTSGKIGVSHPKYQAYETAIGKRNFVDDIFLDGMLYAALKFSDYPSANIKKINTKKAEQLKGVHRIFTAKDIPGEKKVGLIIQDWSVMVSEGENVHYIGDVVAGVVAESDEIARKAIDLIEIEYKVFKPITDVFEAIAGQRIHEERPNNFDTTCFKIGNADKVIDQSKYSYSGNFRTQRVEHAFLEKEAAIARPDGNSGLELFSQS